MGEIKRWWTVDHRHLGRRVTLGRVEATELELRAALGPYVEINSLNGECFVWGKPKVNSASR